jgi:Lipoprotein amino terminal region
MRSIIKLTRQIVFLLKDIRRSPTSGTVTLPLEALQGLVDRLNQTVASTDELVASFEAKFGSELEHVDQSLLESMRHDARAAISALDSNDSYVVRAALAIVGCYWDLNDESVITKIKSMAVYYADDEVRCAAVTTLGALFHETRDKTVGRLLVRIVRNDGEKGSVRLASYMALFDLIGRPLYEMKCLHELIIPDDFDKGLLEEFSLPG